VSVVGIKIPVREISDFQKKFHPLVLQVPKIKAMRILEGDPNHKMVLISHKNEELSKYIEEKNYSIDENQKI
jgi:hypothetical protein